MPQASTVSTHRRNVDIVTATSRHTTTNDSAIDCTFDTAALGRACAKIYASWRPILSEAETLEQVAEFRRRFASTLGLPALTAAEFDAVIELVADAMSEA